jgi:ABC-type microcin C transport system duplicated ATPase subunit YejF
MRGIGNGYLLTTEEIANWFLYGQATKPTNLARPTRHRSLLLKMWQRIRGCNGGQRQRISIARAVVLEPNFVVLDEPTSALDMLFQAQMVDLLRELQRKRDLTYMFISHDLRVVASLASHLIVMRHGKVVEKGPAAELFKNPKSDYTRALFAAAFRIEAVPDV